MADTRELQIVISAKDEASKTLQSLGASFGNLVNESRAASIAFAGALSLAGKKIIDIASDMEQAKVSFTVMTGSASTATKTLKDLSDFAKVTPFTFPSIVEASRRLLAYNIEAKDLIPTLKMLGDISSGVGTEKLPQLILAFGQVKAATKLTGMELRQFSEAGVPLLGALVNQANEMGGVLTKVGGISASTSKKIGSLASAAEEARWKMGYLKEQGKENTKQFENLAEKIKMNEARIASFGTAGQEVYTRVKVTAAEMIEKISDGEVKFEDVQKALSGMTEKGGRFFNMMEKQSKTFTGVTSNISDQMVRIALNIAGISTEAETFGEIIEGGAFDMLKNQAEQVLAFLNAVEPKIRGFIDGFMSSQVAIGTVLGLLTGLLLGAAVALWQFIGPLIILGAIGAYAGTIIAMMVELLRQGDPVIWGIVGALGALGIVIMASVIPAFIAWAGAASAAAVAVVVATWPVILIIAAVGVAVGVLAAAWKNNWGGIREKTQAFLDWFGGIFLPFLKEYFRAIVWTATSFFNFFIDKWNAVTGAINAAIRAIEKFLGLNKQKSGGGGGSFQHGGFVPGAYNQAVPALLHGGERVIPRNGVDVNPGGGGGGVNINFSGPVSMDSEDRVQELADKIIRVLGRQNELAGKGLTV